MLTPNGTPLLKQTFSLLLLLGVWTGARPVQAQALLPYTPPLDAEQLQADGLSLAQDAAQLAQFQQYDEALARAQLAAQLAPANPQVLALLGSLYLQISEPQPTAAIAALEQAKQLEPDNALVHFALGSAYFSQADYFKAAQALEAGLRIEPENPGALFDLGNAYYKLNRYDQAIDRYQAAVEQDESFWPAVNNIGLVMFERGNADGAIAQWRASLALAEGETEPQLAIAAALYSQGSQTEEAILLATEALERDSRYASLEFLQEQLWGEQLIGATQALFTAPAVQALISQL